MSIAALYELNELPPILQRRAGKRLAVSPVDCR